MKVTTVSKFGFECPECGEIHTSETKLEAETAWRVDKNALLGDGYVFDQPEEVEAFRYFDDDECVGTNEPEYRTAYQCGECETVYLDKDEAKECCK